MVPTLTDGYYLKPSTSCSHLIQQVLKTKLVTRVQWPFWTATCNCIVTMMMRYTMCVFTMQAMQRMFLTKITSSLTNTVDRDNCQFEEETILAFSNVILVHDVLKVLFSISANTHTCKFSLCWMSLILLNSSNSCIIFTKLNWQFRHNNAGY